MLRSIVSLTIRHFFRNLYFSAITLGSLVVGMAVVVLLFLWDRYEFGYDRQDPDADRVYVVLGNERREGEVNTDESFNVPMADFLAGEVPEVEYMARIDNSEHQFIAGQSIVRESGIYTDSTFFRIFPTTILEGSAEMPLPGKHAVAISEVLARNLFRDTSPLGKPVMVDGKREYIVTAVYREYPRNNSLYYVDFVLPFHSKLRPADEWVNYYVKLHAGADKEAAEQKIDTHLRKVFGHDRVTSYLHSLVDWRLRWNFENGRPSGGRIVYVILFNITGFFILLMACINYVNLATARASRRAREIGVRKVTGATQRVLVRQFLTESLMLSLVTAGFSLIAVALVLPSVRLFLNLPLTLEWSDPVVWLGVIGIAGVAGLAAGIYPAFLLSGVRPAAVLKGNVYSLLAGAGVRKVLVTFQFSLSIGLVFVALIMWQQTDFLLRRDVGYDKHQVINVWWPTDVVLPKESFKTELSRSKSVKAVAFGGASPMEINGYTEVKWAGMPAGTSTVLYGVTVDFDMIPTLGLKLVEGRNFSPQRPSDSSNFIINRKAAEIMGMTSPIGQRITYSMFRETTGEIIGVIEDFHNDDIHLPVAPVVFVAGRPHELFNLFVRYDEGQAKEALAELKSAFAKFYPGVSFTHSFLDEDFEMQMHREIFLGKISVALTAIAIFIAVLGLLGLTLFSVERRTKEVAIRKVLGATVTQVMSLFFREFAGPALVAFLIAFPVANYFIQQYLEAFAYRVPVTVLTFLSVALGALMLIGVVVSFHTYKAAVTNPVEALKCE